VISRLHTGSPLDVALSTNLRFESPDRYDGSKLADDVAAGAVRGTSEMALAGVAAGVFIDTRDSEFITRRGIFYQIGLSGTAGTGDGVAYGEASAVLAHYAPLPGPFIFASRIVASAQFGTVPFYDMLQAGVFEPQYVLGGETGVRGVPNGRYAGLLKFITNTEIRCTPFPRFHVLGQRFLIGTTTFFDWGRVWSDYTRNPALDGTTLGLKYGIGGGLFLQWGEAAIFRIEAAYSPDAVAENPSLPVGIYVSDGAMF
jgi:outer membrane protein assembly factor BamA